MPVNYHKSRFIQSQDGRTTANENSMRQYWSTQIRDAMFQMHDFEIVSMLESNPIEAERLRVCLQMSNLLE